MIPAAPVKFLAKYIAAMRQCCARLPDPRRGRNTRYRIADIGMAAFSVFFTQSPSFLAHQRMLEQSCGHSNCMTLFGMDGIPTDNHIRNILDTAAPEHFDDVFIDMVRDLEARGALRSLHRSRFGLDHPTTLIALDGSEYFSSHAINCPNCSSRTRNRGSDRETVEYFHSFLGAAIVTPERNLALPLPPEIIRPQDGNDKQDCERNAVKRWLGRIAPRLSRLNPVYLGDDLLASQPVCDAIFNAGASFILTAKPSSHKALYEELSRRQAQTRRRTVTTGKRKITKRVHAYRWVEDVPVRSGAGAFKVTWIGHEISDPASGRVRQSFARITNLKVDRHNVQEIAECGRARWKVENEGMDAPCPTAS